MGSTAPYLQRRGSGLTFRIAVPTDIRPHLGVRELTKALPKTSRQEAVALALLLAHQAKQLFIRLRRSMNKSHTSPDDLLDVGFTLELDLDDFGFTKRVRVQAEAHEEAAVNAALRTVLESGRNRAAPAPTEITAPPSITALLRKLREGRSCPDPRRIYATRTVSGVPSCVNRFRMAARTCSSAT